MIASSLGLTLCLATFACVRVCTQASTQATRLSIENRLLGQGYLSALDELDYWTRYDDPHASAQPLRAPGEPFQPLPFTGDLTLDPDQSAPANWWRGVGCTNDPTTAPAYGRYDRIAANDPGAPFRHQPMLLDRVASGLGFVALFDYAPANLLYSHAESGGAIPPRWWEYADMPDRLAVYDTRRAPRDFCGATHGGAFVITLDPVLLAAGASHHRFDLWSWSGPWGDPWTGRGAVAASASTAEALPLSPAHWPRVQTTVRHLSANYRHLHAAGVRLVSPLTGEVIRLSFTTTTTTLRGARRQRRSTSGWAKPGDPTLDD